jgi:2,3-bisphosphoglycerate-independent phosphoglycerate mutase
LKYVIIHGDGMADWPCEELGGRTPLQAAHKPNMDRIAATGLLGMVATIPLGMPPGSDVGTMSILGYDPARYHTGRAPIEAASMGLEMGAEDVAFRMNLVTIGPGNDGSRIMRDFTAGHVSTEEAAHIVKDLAAELGGGGIEFYPGVSYRHVMIWRNGMAAMRLTPPHDITDKPILKYLPAGDGADVLTSLMRRAEPLLAEHPVNRARRAIGKAEANAIWFWGQGRKPAVPTLKQRFGVAGAVISAVDLANGLGRLAGLEVVTVPGATGYLDTDYAAKGRYGLDCLTRRDFLLVHVEAPDEAGHMGRPDLKREAIERIDELVLGPILNGLVQMGDFALLLMPDHATPCALKTHSADLVPFALYISSQTAASSKRRYTEQAAADTGLVIREGHRLIKALFQQDSLSA